MTNDDNTGNQQCRNNETSISHTKLLRHNDVANDCCYRIIHTAESCFEEQINDNLKESLQNLPDFDLESSTIAIVKLLARYRAKRDYLELLETGNQPYSNDNGEGAV